MAPAYYRQVEVLLQPKPEEGWIVRGWCNPVEPQPAQPVSASDFFWRWDAGEASCVALWGKATFSQGGDDRLLLGSLDVESYWGVK